MIDLVREYFNHEMVALLLALILGVAFAVWRLGVGKTCGASIEAAASGLPRRKTLAVFVVAIAPILIRLY